MTTLNQLLVLTSLEKTHLKNNTSWITTRELGAFKNSFHIPCLNKLIKDGLVDVKKDPGFVKQYKLAENGFKHLEQMRIIYGTIGPHELIGNATTRQRFEVVRSVLFKKA